MELIFSLAILFVGLIIVGLLIKFLAKSTGDAGASFLGGLMSGCGTGGCGCMIGVVLLLALVVFLLVAALSSQPS